MISTRFRFLRSYVRSMIRELCHRGNRSPNWRLSHRNRARCGRDLYQPTPPTSAINTQTQPTGWAGRHAPHRCLVPQTQSLTRATAIVKIWKSPCASLRLVNRQLTWWIVHEQKATSDQECFKQLIWNVTSDSQASRRLKESVQCTLQVRRRTVAFLLRSWRMPGEFPSRPHGRPGQPVLQ